MVRPFARGAMGHQDSLHGVDPSISRSSQCSTTGATKAVVSVILSGMMHIKEPLLLIGKKSPCGSSRFPLAI